MKKGVGGPGVVIQDSLNPAALVGAGHGSRGEDAGEIVKHSPSWKNVLDYPRV